MHYYTLVLVLSLLSVTLVQSEAPGGPPPLDPLFDPLESVMGSLLSQIGSHGSEGTLRGKPCKSVLDCGFGFLYCIDGTCQEKQPGRDCVVEGGIYTGGMSCCPPMANPQQVNTPCKLLSTTACATDHDCSLRNGYENSKCCPSADDGRGLCISRLGNC